MKTDDIPQGSAFAGLGMVGALAGVYLAVRDADWMIGILSVALFFTGLRVILLERRISEAT